MAKLPLVLKNVRSASVLDMPSSNLGSQISPCPCFREQSPAAGAPAVFRAAEPPPPLLARILRQEHPAAPLLHGAAPCGAGRAGGSGTDPGQRVNLRAPAAQLQTQLALGRLSACQITPGTLLHLRTVRTNPASLHGWKAAPAHPVMHERAALPQPSQHLPDREQLWPGAGRAVLLGSPKSRALSVSQLWTGAASAASPRPPWLQPLPQPSCFSPQTQETADRQEES